METYRLKNIAILILLLLNGFLLLLLGYQYLQARRAETDTAGQLQALYEANELKLSVQIDLEEQSLPPLNLSRRSETERAIASWLLGSEAAAASQGGGIYSYEGDHGTIQFRSGGSFDGSRLTLPVDDITEFCRQFCQQFGYEDLQFQVQNRTGSVTAVQQLSGVPISGCGLTLRFERGMLTSVSGAHVNLEDAVAAPAERMTCVTALVRFLDYRTTAGIVCGAVEEIRCVYELHSGPSLRLLPMWRIDTDTYTYFVDCATGEVTRH